MEFQTKREAIRARKKALGSFLAERKLSTTWRCCATTFSTRNAMLEHASRFHAREIEILVDRGQNTTRFDSNEESDADWPLSPIDETSPRIDEIKGALTKRVDAWKTQTSSNCDLVILFYKYADFEKPTRVATWQRRLCERLRLRGKIRVATEGINGTVGGSLTSIASFVDVVLSHPSFSDMTVDDFKSSLLGETAFPAGLEVRVCEEIVPLEKPKDAVSYKNAGERLLPKEFHERVLEIQKDTLASDTTVLLDCRNYYESRIGKFDFARAPNIRKFSYFPEYFDRNEEFFKGKTVLMYCTGGIRCERASAYLKSKSLCRDVFQLSGGIHKYLEQYPDGFFRGKLYVFDERKTIRSNDDVISNCFYCGCPWDEYEHCTTVGCRQLVLSCERCRDIGKTHCCDVCKQGPLPKKEFCRCTSQRQRIPDEHS